MGCYIIPLCILWVIGINWVYISFKLWGHTILNKMTIISLLFAVPNMYLISTPGVRFVKLQSLGFYWHLTLSGVHGRRERSHQKIKSLGDHLTSQITPRAGIPEGRHGNSGVKYQTLLGKHCAFILPSHKNKQVNLDF